MTVCRPGGVQARRFDVPMQQAAPMAHLLQRRQRRLVQASVLGARRRQLAAQARLQHLDLGALAPQPLLPHLQGGRGDSGVRQV